MSESRSELWDFAELTAFDGLLHGQRRVGSLHVPQVALHDHRRFGRCLHWEPPYKWVAARKGHGILESFLKLDNKPDLTFERFAQSWGVLGVRRFHKGKRWGLGYGGPLPVCWPAFHWEPLELWRLLVRRFRACLDIAAHVHQGKLVPHTFWEHLWRPAPQESDLVLDLNPDGPAKVLTPEQFHEEFRKAHEPRTSSVPPELAWKALVAELNMLFSFAELQPWLEAQGPGRFALNLEGLSVGNLYGWLICQLAAALSHPQGLVRCSACGREFTPSRRPAANRARYCPDPECQKEKSRRTSKRHYEKRATKRRQ